MNAAYEDVLKRLKEERKRLRLTQRDMCRCTAMGPASYNKVESGLRRLNFYEVKRLCESRLNVYYIFTGQWCGEEIREPLLKYNYRELLNLLNILVSVVELDGRRKEAERWRRLLHYAAMTQGEEWSGHPGPGIFLRLRQYVGCNQQEMSDRLGVDVKKLRELENGGRLPDSELLSRLYSEFGVSPAVVLQEGGCLAGELGCLLREYDFKGVERILRAVLELEEK